jgi:hypothetical protein
VLLVALAVALGGAPSPDVKPWPIGVGPGYRLPAAPHAVSAARKVGRFQCTSGRSDRRFGAHLEIFVRRRVLIVPAGIGVAAPHQVNLGRVVPGGCSYAIRTLDPTGVLEVRAGAPATLGDAFRLWGQRLGRRRIAGFRSTRPVLAFVGGRRWRGDPRAIPLVRHAQIVLELGGYVPPHPRYLFAGGL